MVVHQPIKTNQITIAPEHPWETTISGSSTVIKAGDVYHLWYSARAPKKRDPDTGEPMWNKGRFQSLAYARSQDGIHWEKPMLGLAEIFGSKENNIVLGYGAGGVKEGLIGTTVFLDPNAVAEERFRQLAYVRNPPALPAFRPAPVFFPRRNPLEPHPQIRHRFRVEEAPPGFPKCDLLG